MPTDDKSALFRMSFIIQDNNATTVQRHLVRIIEAIIFDSDKEYLSVEDIRDSIISKLDLEFDASEIEKAIGSKHTSFIKNKDNGREITISPKCASTLSSKGTYNDSLRKHVSQAIQELELDVQIDELCQLITNHLYQSFNTNKNVILALITKNYSENNSDGLATESNENKKLINAFLDWENDEKNEFIYKLISYCYVYCSMTVKKDNMLNKALFRGKRFYLDANIIFRLAGINNDSRKLSISSFVSRSNDLGIDLCYTNITQEEINRVITSRVSWIRSITGGTEPIDTSKFTDSEDDFFKLYRSWAKDNDYTDFNAFHRYLNRLIYSVTDHYRIERIPDYIRAQKNEVALRREELFSYKKKRTAKLQSESSLNTDICNVMYIEEKRGRNADNNLWSVNDYFISADQGLISWANDLETETIPIVVLPSVWLTIMLRFTSRTSDDYKAFCSFMELRTSVEPDSFNVYKLLASLATRTDSKELKERIVQEVYENREKYNLENYDTVADKVFDTILENKNERERNELIETRAKLEEAGKENQKRAEIAAKQQEEQIRRIDEQVEKDIQRFCVWNAVGRAILWIFFVAICIGTLVATLTGIWRVNPGYGLFKAILPLQDYSTNTVLTIAGIVVAILVGLGTQMPSIVKKTFGESRIANKRDKIRKKYMSIIMDDIGQLQN